MIRKKNNDTKRRRRSVWGKQTLALNPCLVPPTPTPPRFLQELLNVAALVLWWWRWRREVKGLGLLLGVELVLQLHELPGSFDLVGHLLPLREETLALLKGQALRSVTGDRVLLLLAATHRWSLCFASFPTNGSERTERLSPLRPFVSRVLVDFSRSYNSCWVSSVRVKSCPMVR